MKLVFTCSFMKDSTEIIPVKPTMFLTKPIKMQKDDVVLLG